MLVPLKRRPEATPNNADADLLRRGTNRHRALWKRHRSGHSTTGLL